MNLSDALQPDIGDIGDFAVAATGLCTNKKKSHPGVPTLTGKSIQLSEQALTDLRVALRASYGQDFDSCLTDDQVNNLGNLLLTILAEYLMLGMASRNMASIEMGMVK